MIFLSFGVISYPYFLLLNTGLFEIFCSSKNLMIKFSTVSDFLNRGTASVSSWSTLGVIVYEVGTFLSSGFLFIRIETAPS